MSQQEVEIARQPIFASPSPPPRRLEERLSLRFPGLRVRFNPVFLGLAPSSRIPRFLVRRAPRMALEASTRGDYEAAASPAFAWGSIEFSSALLRRRGY